MCGLADVIYAEWWLICVQFFEGDDHLCLFWWTGEFCSLLVTQDETAGWIYDSMMSYMKFPIMRRLRRCLVGGEMEGKERVYVWGIHSWMFSWPEECKTCPKLTTQTNSWLFLVQSLDTLTQQMVYQWVESKPAFLSKHTFTTRPWVYGLQILSQIHFLSFTPPSINHMFLLI